MVAGTDTAAARLTPSAPGNRTGAAPALPLAHQLREYLSAYLPLLLMGLLALATWWLVENAPEVERTRAAKPLRHIADYTMNDFSVRRYTADGRLRVQIEGSELRHFPDTDTIEIDAPRIRAIANDGKLTVAKARQAISNADGSEVQLLGSAEVVREAAGDAPKIEFHGEFLHAFLDAGELRSHLPVLIRQGATQLRADALDYKHDAQRLQLNGRVRATFAPPGRAAGARP
ncbi:LPS export ABC transporter periplasmic protein LptC [Piscinibacter sakaiensis]|uniref:LPS export ABC transporter periplasmic protein LptC n=1 Tax=Piscinibacter sakaiensis TaxID=1547922 RepID=UPI003AAE9484